jgi:CRISPR system Cascade subunit CasB
MTTTGAAVAPKQRGKPQPGRRRGPFGGHVAKTVALLQEEYRAQRPAAIATVARLRAAVLDEPGASYAVLDVTRVSEGQLEERHGDEPTPRERAKHAALTLYAIHQQSRQDASMHVDGVALGEAVNRLAYASKGGDAGSRRAAVVRRFAALGTAETWEQLLHHLRSLVRQLRDERVALDYGLLAEDLVRFHGPGGPERVRALWGRDFYRTELNNQTTSNPETPGKEPQS